MPHRPALSDCDESGRFDLCEIAEGELIDSDRDGLPDVCTPGFTPFDLDGSGVVDGADLASPCTFRGALTRAASEATGRSSPALDD